MDVLSEPWMGRFQSSRLKRTVTMVMMMKNRKLGFLMLKTKRIN